MTGDSSHQQQLAYSVKNLEKDKYRGVKRRTLIVDGTSPEKGSWKANNLCCCLN